MSELQERMKRQTCCLADFLMHWARNLDISQPSHHVPQYLNLKINVLKALKIKQFDDCGIKFSKCLEINRLKKLMAQFQFNHDTDSSAKAKKKKSNLASNFHKKHLIAWVGLVSCFISCIRVLYVQWTKS